MRWSESEFWALTDQLIKQLQAIVQLILPPRIVLRLLSNTLYS